MTTPTTPDLAAAVAALLAAKSIKCPTCYGRGSYSPHCYRCGDSTDDHRCPPSEPCPCVEPGGITHALRLARAALDAVPVVRWVESEGGTVARVGQWVLDVRATTPGVARAYSWETHPDGVSLDWGFADTLADAQRAAVAALRSLGVAVREEACDE